MADKKSSKKAKPTARKAASAPKTKSDLPRELEDGAFPKLLSGGNPQVATAEGDAVVQTYIDAMPGWKSQVGRRLDHLITRAVPNVRKAVKWNSPFYGLHGIEGMDAWFLAIHCFTKYIKIAFFRGKLLRPPPPGKSKQKEVSYLDIHENALGNTISESQFVDWVKQAVRLQCASGDNRD